MGFNLYLYCHDCKENRWVNRGDESWAIKHFSRLHSGHRTDAAIDNGFAEKWFVDEDATCLEFPTKGRVA